MFSRRYKSARAPIEDSDQPAHLRSLIRVFDGRSKKTFCGFSMGRNQYWAGRVYDLCVYYMTGTPEGSTESGFMEKPGIEPATPGLQGIALIHYTTGALSVAKGFDVSSGTGA